MQTNGNAAAARGYEAFNTADVATLMEVFDERASWHTPGRGPLAGDHEGRDATFAQFGRYLGGANGTFAATLERVLESEDGRSSTSTPGTSSGRRRPPPMLGSP